MFRELHGHWPDPIRAPGFNDLIQRRKLFDRNPLYTVFCDKFAVDDFVRDRVGGDILVERPWTGFNPMDIPFDALPYPVVIKPSHASGWSRFLYEAPDRPAREALIQSLQEVLRLRYGRKMAESGYDGITPRVLVEPLLLNSAGEPAPDFKFFVFHGQVACILFVIVRDGIRHRHFFDVDWQQLEVTEDLDTTLPGPHPRPALLDEMIEAAGTIAAGFDLYDAGGRVHFGEITVYPGSGIEPMNPPAWDRTLATFWRDRHIDRAGMQAAQRPFLALSPATHHPGPAA